MHEFNKDKSRVIMPINDFANICGYFFNANFDDSCDTCPNNGYNCRNPECEEKSNGIGCCYSWGCPFGWSADEEDCLEFGWDYEENEFIVICDPEILEKLNSDEKEGCFDECDYCENADTCEQSKYFNK